MFYLILAFPMPRRKNGQIAGTPRSFIIYPAPAVQFNHAKRIARPGKFAICSLRPARYSGHINAQQSDRTIFLPDSAQSGGASVLASRERRHA